MPEHNAPNVTDMVSAGDIVLELEDDCPLKARYAPQRGRVAVVDVWKLRVQLGGRSTRGRYRKLPVNLAPLFDLYENLPPSREPAHWTHDFYYLELLGKEQRLHPEFWIKTDAWGRIRRACQLSLRAVAQNRLAPGSSSWDEQWKQLLVGGIIRRQTPDDWLEMVEWDSENWDLYGTFHDSVRWRMIPVFDAGAADRTRRAMCEDMADVLLTVPMTEKELMERCKNYAHRLGWQQRWPSRHAQLVEYRTELVLSGVRAGLTPAAITEQLLAMGLYPLDAGAASSDGEGCYEGARRTVYRIITRLKQVSYIKEGDVTRRPPGRPPKLRD